MLINFTELIMLQKMTMLLISGWNHYERYIDRNSLSTQVMRFFANLLYDVNVVSSNKWLSDDELKEYFFIDNQWALTWS